MAALSEHDPPASYILTYAEYMGRPCQTLLQDDDLLLIGMAPVHPDPDLAKKEELLITSENSAKCRIDRKTIA
jgi:hypothetical protein